ncbi:hypothetical protein E3N88_24691 [Mikania micrantha]|uniref:Uncharacterized protein n=1 Tax=Mikania micrantha TaxID=192012 RepID=A0A5N6N3X1_9ASTR|nr:hypothetical protein E3N88_24691 [Mikania micrantha]
MSWWDGDFFFGQYSDVSHVAEIYQDKTGTQSSEATNRPALPDHNEDVAGQTSYCQFDLNQEPCDDEDVNRECYGGEQSHPPKWPLKRKKLTLYTKIWTGIPMRAVDNGYVVVTGRSKKKKGTDDVNKIWLVCDRGGEHNSTTIFRREGADLQGVYVTRIARFNGLIDLEPAGMEAFHPVRLDRRMVLGMRIAQTFPRLGLRFSLDRGDFCLFFHRTS